MATKATPYSLPGVGRLVLAVPLALILAVVPLKVRAAESIDPNITLEQLGTDDVVRYRQIFDLQERGKWKRADRIVRNLETRVLMGRVLFQRYMHPTKYRSKYKELYDWMKAYADQPGAKRIYRLALRRQPSGYKAPRRPIAALNHRFGVVPEHAYQSPRKRSAKQRRWVGKIRAGILRQVSRGNPSGAEKRLKRGETRQLLDSFEYDEMRRRVAAAYFFKGKDRQALALASSASENSRRHVPLADWTAGLAAWRLGRLDTARVHFEHLARSKTSSEWNIAAGAFWAARANLVTGRAPAVNPLLKTAAKSPHTFYGLIAARLLGRDISFNWAPPPLDPTEIQSLLEMKSVRRAIALRQVHQIHWAERELGVAHAQSESTLHQTLLALADRLELARPQLSIGKSLLASGHASFDSAKYPLPGYREEQRHGIDRALVYAFIRQESGFNSRAKSPRGAYGLMQLMPRTASAMAKDRNIRRRDRWRLYLPEFNIELGRKYLSHLSGLEGVQGNLFLMAAAYNGGPGNLRKWQRRTKYRDDPLLFIESLPSLETRLFIERVLANFWIYRERLGQDTPSLDAIAAGNWPYYFELDTKGVRVAQNRAIDAN